MVSLHEIESNTSNSVSDGSVNGGGSKSTGESQSGTSESRNTDDELNTIKDQLTKKETRDVFRLRVLVITILLLAGGSVSAVVCVITKNAMDDEFHLQYNGASEKVLASFDGILTQMGAISGLGIGYTARSIDYNDQWPFVTLSHFQERAGNARTLSQTLYVSLNPVVTREDRQAWEEYVLGPDNYWM